MYNSVLAQERPPFNNLNISEDSVFILEAYQSYVDSINQIITSIDIIYEANPERIDLMAIIEDAKKAIPLPNREWPKNVTTSINIIRDESGKIIFYAESPFSESGDWYIEYKYLIDTETKKPLAFIRLANFFNSICSDDAVFEKSIYYFSKKGKIMSKSYSLKNSKGDSLEDKDCWFNYDHEYKIEFSLDKILNKI